MKKILVNSLLAHFKFFAKLQLKKIKPVVIGTTGSAGKTSARNAVAAVLSSLTEKKIKVSYKANSETGIPLNILGLSPKSYSLLNWLRLAIMVPIKYLTNHEKYDFYVVEIGIDSPYPPKNMGFPLTIVQPSVGVFLNAKPMHSEPFDHLVEESDPEKRSDEISKLIAKEKGKMIAGLPSKERGGVAVLNFDDKNVAKLANQTKAEVWGFGKIAVGELVGKNRFIKILTPSISIKGSLFKFEVMGKKHKLMMKDMFLPEHFAHTFASAIAVGLSQGILIDKIFTALKNNFKLPPGRSSLIPGINHSLILDSSYNSSAQPLLDSLKLIDEVGQGRRLALLGDMRELGEETKLEHETIAKKASKVCDLVVLVGPAMNKYALPILERNDIETHWFETAGRAGEFLKTKLKKDDLLLVKGSQNTLFLEIAVKEMMLNKQDAKKLLCRRGEFWDRKRKLYL